MIAQSQHRPPPMSALPNSTTASGHRLVSFTTPPNYAPRLSRLITLKGWSPLWCPTVIVEPTPQTISSIQHFLSNLEPFSGVAFTSRTGIAAFAQALTAVKTTPLAPQGEPFTLSALGKDAELLNEALIAKLCKNSARVRVTVPPVATPSCMAESLGSGLGRKVLCPVPLVVGLNEPPVVAAFLSDLAKMGWIPVRVNGYETRWAGARSGELLVKRAEGVDALVFTSTAEVEGFLKSLADLGLSWEMMRKRWPAMIVAAHGPVTASGAERLGVGIDVVGSRFHSFDGVVDALACTWNTHY